MAEEQSPPVIPWTREFDKVASSLKPKSGRSVPFVTVCASLMVITLDVTILSVALQTLALEKSRRAVSTDGLLLRPSVNAASRADVT